MNHLQVDEPATHSIEKIIRTTLRKYTVNTEEEESLRSELLLKIFQLEKKTPLTKSNTNLYYWALGNVGKDFLRNKSRTVQAYPFSSREISFENNGLPGQELSLLESTEQVAIDFSYHNVDTRILINSFLKRLTAQEKKILQHYYLGYSQDEISKLIKCSLSHYDRRLRKIKDKAEKFYQKNF